MRKSFGIWIVFSTDYELRSTYFLERRLVFAHLCFGRKVAKVAFFYGKERGFLFVKPEVNFSHGAIAVLLNKNFRDAGPVGILIHLVVAVYEHDDVGILLQRAGIAKIGEARLSTARESCESAITGTFSSLAMAFNAREISVIC